MNILVLPLNQLQARPRSLYPALKRGTDVAISIVLLVLFGILVLPFVAFAIKWDSPGTVFFCQQRTGYKGRTFTLYKLRTLRTEHSHATGGAQVMLNDDRVTYVGEILRRYHLDELPQILNVIKGDMSLVGPRPHAVDHHEYYKSLIPHFENRLNMLPGLTGWAQIQGCSGPTPHISQMAARLDHDIAYIQKASYFTDIKILWRTLLIWLRLR